jgi:hypothetical protein
MTIPVRSRLLAALTPQAIVRSSVDFGLGAGLAWLASFWIAHGQDLQLLTLAIFVPVLLITFATGRVGAGLLRLAARRLSRPPQAGRSGGRRWLVVVTVAGCGLGLLLWRAGPAAVWAAAEATAVRALPAVLVAVAGTGALTLTRRRTRAARSRWVRRATDLVAAVVAALVLLAAFSRDLLVTAPAAGLLFPLIAWFSIRMWQVLGRSRHLAVRAGADIVLSLMLGADLVLLLAWVANLLGLPEGEVAALRGTLERAGAVVDLPWWLWSGLYLVLAGMSLSFARWPAPLEAISRRWQRLRVVPSVDVTRRAMTGVHIGLAVTMLIGLAAPAALGTALRGELRSRYTLTVQREQLARGAQAAYSAIWREFSSGTITVPQARPLAGMISKIDNVSRPPPSGSATRTERDLARRLGQAQAATLRLARPTAADPAAGPPAVLDSAARGAADLDQRLDELGAQQRRAKAAEHQADEAGELAAVAVAGLVQVPGLDASQVVQIVREYLSGLVEGSRVKDVFAAWARQFAGRGTAPPPAETAVPPAADKLVVPDPPRLELATLVVLLRVRLTVELANPFSGDRAEQRTLSESAADAAVDLANEARYLQEGTGPCVDCPRPLRPGDEPFERPGEHPEEPHDVPVR